MDRGRKNTLLPRIGIMFAFVADFFSGNGLFHALTERQFFVSE